MPSLQEMQAQREALDAQINEMKATAKANAITQCKELMEANGLSVSDLVPTRARPSKGGTIAAKYRGPNGETWSGRGLIPRWLRAAQAEGKSLADFAVE